LWVLWPTMAIAIGLVVAITAVVVWKFAFYSPQGKVAPIERIAFSLPDKPSIAVLPFENMSGDPEQEYFSDGLTEEIITALSKTPKLFVIAGTSSFKYKGKKIDLRTVGRELGVRYVLEGSVRSSKDQLRITAQLIDTKTGNHLWAERYDRELKDVFSLQDEFTMKVITALQIRLTEGEQARMMGTGTDNLDAYLLYLQAVEQTMHMNKDGNVLARKMIEKAIALDPNYAAAYRILANTYWVDIPLGLTKDAKQSIAKAMQLLHKSVALDKYNSSGLTHSLLGWFYTLMRQHEKGISECERGVLLEPSSAMAYLWLGLVLRYAGIHEEAIRMYKEAIRLNPIPPAIYYHGLSITYCLAGQYEAAITAGKEAIRLEPDNLVSHAFLAVAYSVTGREEEARMEAEEVLRMNPGFSVEHWARTSPYKSAEDKELIISNLLKSGLK
jgi:adenylate cyclase